MGRNLSLAVFVAMVALYLFEFTSAQGSLEANDAEKQICEDNASNRTLDDATKNRRLSCKIICKYADGSQETYNSPDGQMCDDMVGLAPTGMCRDGRCPIGGLGK